MRTRAIALFAVLAAGPAPALADFELGRQAYERGDYEAALGEWLPMAEQGHAEAQYRVGRLYYYARGVERDYATAAEWYRRAAEQGHARSQSNLGYLYENGLGLQRDDLEAAAWYRRAADNGRAMAQFRLARMYAEGRGVPRDDAEAASWLDKAARQGHAEAQAELARCYEQGRGVPRDEKKAKKWFRRAAKRGVATPGGDGLADDEEAAAVRGGPVADAPAISVEIGVPPEPQDEIESTAEPAEPAATPAPAPEYDVADGQAAYERGDYEDALRIWLPLAQGGDPEAQFRVGHLYRVGQGVAVDLVEAGGWYLRAAERGHAMAIYQVAFLYLRGRGVTDREDPVRAYAWFVVAAERGIGDAHEWRDTLARKLTQREIERARALAREWREKQ